MEKCEKFVIKKERKKIEFKKKLVEEVEARKKNHENWVANSLSAAYSAC